MKAILALGIHVLLFDKQV